MRVAGNVINAFRVSALFAVFLTTLCFAGDIPKASPAVKAPEFIGTSDDWINSKPLAMQDLRGKVVLVDFWEYTCVNCIRTYPYLKAWWDRYKAKGLVIVGIHSPEFKFAADKKNVAQSAEEYGLNFPILVDSRYQNWNAWHNEVWPAKYLVDANGIVVASHMGEGRYAETEAEIQKLLRMANPSIQLPQVLPEVRNDDKPGAVCYPITPEMYAGSRGVEDQTFGYRNRPIGRETNYALPTELLEGTFYLGGKWTPEDQYLESAIGSQLSIRYKAKEANLVLRPTASPVTVDVLQDGQPIRKDDAGSDIAYENGMSHLVVANPRMYNVTNNAKWGHHRLDFRILGPGLQVYSFAFSSECEQ